MIVLLVELVNISKEFGCVLLVDEFYFLGIYGFNGVGLLVELGFICEVYFMIVSLVKIFVYCVGVIWCNNEVNCCVFFISYLVIFSFILLFYEVVGLEMILEIIEFVDNCC